MTITDADREALTDEIAEAISDSLDMDWQPKWATPAIIAILERERIAAEQAGARKMQEAAAKATQIVRDKVGLDAIPCAYCEAEIRALDPEEICR